MARAKARKFKCSKCDRTFAMAAHLARHQSTTHGTKSRKKAVRSKAARPTARTMLRRARRGTGRAPQSQAAPLLLQMQTYRDNLLAQRAQVSLEIDAIDKALAAMGGAVRAPGRKSIGGRRGGGARAGSLKSYIERVLSAGGGKMAVKDVATAVRKAGFKTRNRTLAKSVGVALSEMSNVRKVSRGTFCLK